MVATLKVNSIQRNNADSDMITLHDTGVTHHTPINFTHTPTIAGVGMFNGAYSGQPLTIAMRQAQAPAHITVTSTSFTTLALECPITVRDGSSTNEVIFFSNMAYGVATPMYLDLWYNVNGGSYTDLTTYVSYHWSYFYDTWGPRSWYFQHTHGASAGDTLSYQLRYANQAAGTNYLVHTQMIYGWKVTEVAG